MQEICQSGSEGGAKPTFVPTPIVPRKEPSRRVRYDRAQLIPEAANPGGISRRDVRRVSCLRITPCPRGRLLLGWR